MGELGHGEWLVEEADLRKRKYSQGCFPMLLSTAESLSHDLENKKGLVRLRWFETLLGTWMTSSQLVIWSWHSEERSELEIQIWKSSASS